MNGYQVKSDPLPGTSYKELIKNARQIFHVFEKRTKRKPYLRSAYFAKEKVFFDFFWAHLQTKSFRDRVRRLRYFPCAIELVQNSRQKPTSKTDVQNNREILHRFRGLTPQGEIFFVQIKENTKTGKKYLMSVFPLE